VDQSNCQLLWPDESRQLLERATLLKRLAVGAADPDFATKLQALVTSMKVRPREWRHKWKRQLRSQTSAGRLSDPSAIGVAHHFLQEDH
jgi:hypothetical protein